MRQIRIKKSPTIKIKGGRTIELCVAGKTVVTPPLFNLSIPFKLAIADDVLVVPQVSEKLAQHGYYVIRWTRDGEAINVYLGCAYGAQAEEVTLKKGDAALSVSLASSLYCTACDDEKDSTVTVV